MRIRSTRKLELPITPDEGWRALVDLDNLSRFSPEIDDAYRLRDGSIRIEARVGKRRRFWDAQLSRDDSERKLELTSTTAGVDFKLVAKVRAAVEPAGGAAAEGADVEIMYELNPPDEWKADGKAALVKRRRAAERLVVSSLLFAASTAGVLALPSLELSPVGGAVAYSIVGILFLVAVAFLSGGHGRPRRLMRGRFRSRRR